MTSHILLLTDDMIFEIPFCLSLICFNAFWHFFVDMGQDRTDENHNPNGLSNLDYSAPRPSNVPTVVHVYRPSEVEDKRKDLPIVMMEQEIMEAINDCSSVIICGETGCGKTTQVPQVSLSDA